MDIFELLLLFLSNVLGCIIIEYNTWTRRDIGIQKITLIKKNKLLLKPLLKLVIFSLILMP